MKRAIIILLCLLFASCSHQLLREEKMADLNIAFQQYLQNDVKRELAYYNKSYPYLPENVIKYNIVLSNNIPVFPAQVRFEGNIMVDMKAKGLVSFINQPAKQYGNYYFHMATESDGRLIIYAAFQNSHKKWHMLTIPVN